MHLHNFSKIIFFACLLSRTMSEQMKLDGDDIDEEEPKKEVAEPVAFNTTSYGKDRFHVADFYYPTIPIQNVSHVIILIHGGGWAYGQRSDMNFCVPFLREAFPSYLIINMDYRLASWSSPGYPKQIQDLERLIQFTRQSLLKKGDAADVHFTLFGISAGAHLAMLYGYKYNDKGYVKAVVDIVGPVDLEDPMYVMDPIYDYVAFSLVGPRLYFLDKKIYHEASPINYITTNSPPTIGFYGNIDPLVPPSQMEKLRKRLTKEKVPHKLTMFTGGHFFDWQEKDKETLRKETVSFLKKHFQ